MKCENVGIVVIGRNEGARLQRCLESLPTSVEMVVYVDSGSTDGSVDLACSLGVDVIELDNSAPYTAARARNRGLEWLRDARDQIEFVQFLDGDCELRPGWIKAAIAAFASHPGAAVITGRLYERNHDQSIYSRLCAAEWLAPIGQVDTCGGICMTRIAAVCQVGGFDASLIAGEEADLCRRLRQQGGDIYRIASDMADHDAAITRFGQWWTRTARSGHAFAEGAARAGREHRGFHQVRSILFWTILVPLAILVSAVTSIVMSSWMWGLTLFLLLGYGVLWLRIYRHLSGLGAGSSDAFLYACFCVIGKFAQLLGVLSYWIHRGRNRRSELIEYKDRPEEEESMASGQRHKART